MLRPPAPSPLGPAHRCCWWLPLRRGVIAIGCFYCVYLLSVAVALAVGASVAGVPALAAAAAVAALLAAAAAALLAGTLLRRSALLLLWLVTYGAALAALTLGGLSLAIAAELGQHTFLTRFCDGQRCQWRLFHYLLLLHAAEWYWWACVLLLYRRMGRQRAAHHHQQAPLPVTLVRGAHNGRLKQVPVVYVGDTEVKHHGVG